MRSVTVKIAALCLAAFAAAGPLAAQRTAQPALQGQVIARLDLAKPFATLSPWQFFAAQGPSVEDAGGNEAPGEITPCLTGDNGRTCHAAPGKALRIPQAEDVFAVPHFINRLAVVQPRADLPLLLLELASFHAGNGDQRIAMQLYAYDKAKDDFTLAFEHRTGRNNNQEIRYVEAGPLKGDIVTSDPTSDAPYGYWIAVHRLTPSAQYRQILRFRSATTYGDGNPLAVIDSEMPNIQRRLGLWRDGTPLPLPAGKCPRPHLVRMALWCN